MPHLARPPGPLFLCGTPIPLGRRRSVTVPPNQDAHQLRMDADMESIHELIPRIVNAHGLSDGSEKLFLGPVQTTDMAVNSFPWHNNPSEKVD